MGTGVVIELDEHRPHLCLVCVSGDAHVIPLVALQRMATGHLPLINEGQEAEDYDLLQSILLDWLVINGYM